MRIERTPYLEDTFIQTECDTEGLLITILRDSDSVTLLTIRFSRDALADKIAEIDDVIKSTIDGLALVEEVPLAPIKVLFDRDGNTRGHTVE